MKIQSISEGRHENINQKFRESHNFFNGEPVRISSCYLFGPVENPIENNYLNKDIDCILKDKDMPVAEGEYLEFRNGKKVQCIYHDKTMKNSRALDFSDFQINDNERIFVINNIHC